MQTVNPGPVQILTTQFSDIYFNIIISVFELAAIDEFSPQDSKCILRQPNQYSWFHSFRNSMFNHSPCLILKYYSGQFALRNSKSVFFPQTKSPSFRAPYEIYSITVLRFTVFSVCGKAGRQAAVTAHGLNQSFSNFITKTAN
jgi:hypothetical protein